MDTGGIQDVGTIGSWTPSRLTRYIQNEMNLRQRDAKTSLSADQLFAHNSLTFSSGDFQTADTKVTRPRTGVLAVNNVPILKMTSSALSGGPPGSPSDGDIWIATAVDANGTVWQFRYNAGSASAYKWEFIGGSKMSATASPGSTASLYATYVDLTGPSITVARGGDYLIGYAADAYNTSAGGGAAMNVRSTNVAENDANMTYTGASVAAGTVSNVGSICKEVVLLGVTAGDAIKCRYASISTGTSTYERAQILVQPIRIS